MFIINPTTLALTSTTSRGLTFFKVLVLCKTGEWQDHGYGAVGS